MEDNSKYMFLGELADTIGRKPTTETTTDDLSLVKTGAVKYDAGKSPIYRGALSYFPRALSEVSSVSAFGATKYQWSGWRSVPDAVNRYSDALVRHLTAEAMGEVNDPDSGLPHKAHIAWNALAILEKHLEETSKMSPAS